MYASKPIQPASSYRRTIFWVVSGLFPGCFRVVYHAACSDHLRQLGRPGVHSIFANSSHFAG